ncbi:hypothetical protein HYW94_00865 [Candidatus Uhrbacteria bacterium]|nr:hypothetical protein [Candidatus Uhrbacteria bacterium]
MEICNVAVQESVSNLTEKYNELMHVLDVLSETKKLQKIGGLVSVGHWRMGHKVNPNMGIVHERGQLFHAQGDNMEGSLYIAFSRTVIRIRWAGHRALYLGSIANYVGCRYDKESDRYLLGPERLKGEMIIEVKEDKVWVEDLARIEYRNLIRDLRWEYENQLREARTLPSNGRRIISQLFGQGSSEPSLVLPEAPPLAYRSIEELVSMIDTIRDGIERTIDILEFYVPTSV